MEWKIQDVPIANEWYSITFGRPDNYQRGLFVAVAKSGNGDRVMTSPDGINWTIQYGAPNSNWMCVTFGTPFDSGLFVAVANGGNADSWVMTSPDGINWTKRSCPLQYWKGVCYGTPNGTGLFVAVGEGSSGDRVMTSPDGINWTMRSSPTLNYWQYVTYGDGLFVAVANNGNGNRIMTSPDGINWTVRQSPADNSWNSVVYGNNQFVAVSDSGDPMEAMTSPDGINWTLQQSTLGPSWWFTVTYGEYNGQNLYVAVSHGYNMIEYSSDGINWYLSTPPELNAWKSVTYGNGMFVAVAYSGTAQRVMTAGTLKYPDYIIVDDIDYTIVPTSKSITFDNYVYPLFNDNLLIANTKFNPYMPKSFALSTFHQDKKTIGLFSNNHTLKNIETELVYGQDYSGSLILCTTQCTSGSIIVNTSHQYIILFVNNKNYFGVVDQCNITYNVISNSTVTAYGSYSSVIYDVDIGKYTIYSNEFYYDDISDNIKFESINDKNAIIYIPLLESNSKVIQTRAVSVSSYITYIDSTSILT